MSNMQLNSPQLVMANDSEPVASEQSSALLVLLQQYHYAAAGIPLPNFTDDDSRYIAGRIAPGFTNSESGHEAEESAIRDFLRKTAAQVSSPYEKPLEYMIMKRVSDSIRVAVDSLGLELTSMPVIGTLPLPDINARTVQVPDSAEHLVLFHHGLLMFALMFSKAIVQTFPVMKEADGNGLFDLSISDVSERVFDLSAKAIRKHVAENPSICARFIEAIDGFINVNIPPQYVARPIYSLASGLLIDSLELFVLGHEYGHILARHISANTPAAAMMPSSADSPKALNYSWAQEYEADRYGLILSVAATDEKYATEYVMEQESAFSYAGSELYFGAVDVIDRAISTLTYGHAKGRRSSATHPPASARRLNLRRSLVKIVRPGAAYAVVRMGAAIEIAIEALWEEAMPTFLREYEQRAGSHDA
jgi:hypothetical protein